MAKVRKVEKGCAVASLATAIALAFLSLHLAPDHEIAASNSMAIAQFLTFTATLLGIDYHFANYGTKGNQKQQPAEHTPVSHEVAGQVEPAD